MHRFAKFLRPLAALAVLSLAAAPAGAAADPAAVVERLHEALLGVMKEADALGYAGRYERLEPVVIASFDLPFMARKSVGRYWKEASEVQRAELLQTFRRYTVANYADRFDGHSGQSFETLGQAPSAHGTVVVRTRLVDPTGEPVALDYRLRPVGDGWKIVDVYLNGTVSELALRRSEYSSLIQREGFAALIAALVERVATMEATPANEAS